MKTLLYYPGCSLKRDYQEAERAGIAVLEALGYRVVELRDWYCCGGYPGSTSIDHVKYVSSIRNLSKAIQQKRETGGDTIVTLCPFCYNTIKQAEKLYSMKPDIYRRVVEYLKDEVEPYRGGLRVAHFVEVLYESRSELPKLARRRLSGLKVAVYYGCMLLRPRAVALDNPDKPVLLESILRELGAEPVDYPLKSYCCGSFHSILEPSIVARNTGKIARAIVDSGASIVVTPCPLCLSNLRKYTDLRAVHLSELIAHALGVLELPLQALQG
jgi:heterodisulfide reductase subunit B